MSRSVSPRIRRSASAPSSSKGERATEGMGEDLARLLATRARGDDPGAAAEVEERDVVAVGVLLGGAVLREGAPQGAAGVAGELGGIEVGADAAQDDDPVDAVVVAGLGDDDHLAALQRVEHAVRGDVGAALRCDAERALHHRTVDRVATQLRRVEHQQHVRRGDEDVLPARAFRCLPGGDRRRSRVAACRQREQGEHGEHGERRRNQPPHRELRDSTKVRSRSTMSSTASEVQSTTSAPSA